MEDEKKERVVLDLDGTLIDDTGKLRPGVPRFLRLLRQAGCEPVIWSATRDPERTREIIRSISELNGIEVHLGDVSMVYFGLDAERREEIRRQYGGDLQKIEQEAVAFKFPPMLESRLLVDDAAAHPDLAEVVRELRRGYCVVDPTTHPEDASGIAWVDRAIREILLIINDY